MALLGQASGGFTESNSALRILHVGVRNTVTVLSVVLLMLLMGHKETKDL